MQRPSPSNADVHTAVHTDGERLMSNRRVPKCEINWCCPYRSDLCRFDQDGQCTGERTPKNDFRSCAAMIA